MREPEGRTLPIVTMNEAEGVALTNENVSRMATFTAFQFGGQVKQAWTRSGWNVAPAQ